MSLFPRIMKAVGVFVIEAVLKYRPLRRSRIIEAMHELNAIILHEVPSGEDIGNR